jgi:FtsH-binding integral membrane protein
MRGRKRTFPRVHTPVGKRSSERTSRRHRGARAANPSLPIVCASVTVPSRKLAGIVDFAAVLIESYTAAPLLRAVDQALASASSAAAASTAVTVGIGSSAVAKNASTRPQASRAASGR